MEALMLAASVMLIYLTIAVLCLLVLTFIVCCERYGGMVLTYMRLWWQVYVRWWWENRHQ